MCGGLGGEKGEGGVDECLDVEGGAAIRRFLTCSVEVSYEEAGPQLPFRISVVLASITCCFVTQHAILSLAIVKIVVLLLAVCIDHLTVSVTCSTLCNTLCPPVTPLTPA